MERQNSRSFVIRCIFVLSALFILMYVSPFARKMRADTRRDKLSIIKSEVRSKNLELRGAPTQEKLASILASNKKFYAIPYDTHDKYCPAIWHAGLDDIPDNGIAISEEDYVRYIMDGSIPPGDVGPPPGLVSEPVIWKSESQDQ